MAWEKRERGGRYYTHSRRENGKIVREYFGTGDAAEAIAQWRQTQRKQKAAERDAQEQQRSAWATLNAEAVAVFTSITDVMKQTLADAGYHQHARGEWRKKRMKKKDRGRFALPDDVTGKQIMDAMAGLREGDQAAAEQVAAWFRLPVEVARQLDANIIDTLENIARQLHEGEIGQQARQGDIAALPALRQTLDAQPQRIAAYQGMAEGLIEAILRKVYGHNLYAIEIERRKIKARQLELAGPSATALEQVLAERIVLCLTQVDGYEKQFAAQGATMTAQDKAFYQSQVEQTNKRLMLAIKTLAQVRKMQLPDVQVNIGEKQINIVQQGAALTEANTAQLEAMGAQINVIPEVLTQFDEE